MEHNENIGEVFKDAFDGFEADVPSGAWENIQTRLNQGAGNGGSESGASGSGGSFFTSTGFIAAACTVVGVAITAVILTTGPEEGQANEIAPVETETDTQELVSDIPDNTTIVNEGLQIMSVPTDAALVVDQDDPVVEGIINQADNTGGPNTIVVLDKPTTNNGSIVNNSPMGITNPYGSHSVSTISTPNDDPPVTEDGETVSPSDRTDDDTEVEVQAPATSVLSANKLTGYAPLVVNFTNAGKNITKVDWDFGDGTTSKELNPSHTFELYGEYLVKVTVSNSTSSTTETVSITVEPSSAITGMPNVFSPNGDGYNDQLVIKTEKIEQFYLIVVDMSGNTVFESTSPNRYWDGRDLAGEDLPEGSYTYYVMATGIDGKVHEEFQAVQLRR